MLKYLVFTRLATQPEFVCRAATLAGLATDVFFRLLRAAVANREGKLVILRFDRA
jgi:hypothetical protein